MRRPAIAAFAFVAAAAAASSSLGQGMPPPVTDPAQVPAGHYVTDPNHGGFILKVQHMGMDQSMFRMDKFHAEADFDPAHLEATKVKVDVDPSSFDAPTPAISAEFSKEFLGAPDHPITFMGEHLRKTGANTGVMEGQLTLNGVTKPFAMNVTFNGFRPQGGMGPARVGFTAKGVVHRADFNVGPKMPMGAIGDVDLDVTMEFTKAG